MGQSPGRRLTRFISGLSLVFFLTGSALFVKLLLRRSAEPWIFGFYTLPYFIFLLLAGISLWGLGIWFWRGGERARRLFWGNLWVLGIFLLMIEAGGQAWAFFNPSYEVLFFVPDRMTGWKLAPQSGWTWTGNGLYRQEFETPGQSNSLGFRDRERNFEKPPGTLRIALLGDSFVEAIEVPFEETAGQILEKRLNQTSESASRYEVLNFGISSFSLGQYFLAWEEYAAKFSPDYVFIFIFRRPFERTGVRYETGAFPHTKKKELWVRPTFRLENGGFIREPARDFEAFREIHGEVSRKEFSGKNMRRRRGFFLLPYIHKLKAIGKNRFVDPLLVVQRRFNPSVGAALRGRPTTVHDGPTQRSAPTDTPYFNNQLIQTNLKLIEILAEQVKAGGGRLVLVDVFSYLNPELQEMPGLLQEFSRQRGLDYLDLGEKLLEAEKSGVRVRWATDPHLNAKGNEIFAEAMLNWMAGRPSS